MKGNYSTKYNYEKAKGSKINYYGWQAQPPPHEPDGAAGTLAALGASFLSLAEGVFFL